MPASVHVSRPAEGVALLLLDHPPKNFGTAELAIKLLKAFATEVAAGTKVAVLASDLPGYFMAHWSLAEILDAPPLKPDDGKPKRPGLFDAIEQMPMIVIAANHAQAWGGGSELSWACDLRIAGESATYGQPEVALGLIPGGGGTTRLARLVGPGRCMELILDGRPIGARQAWQIGAVNRVVEDGALRAEAIAWAAWLARHPRDALVACKRSLVEGRDLGLAEARRNETRIFQEVSRTNEAVRIMREAGRAYEAESDSWSVLGFGRDGGGSQKS